MSGRNWMLSLVMLNLVCSTTILSGCGSEKSADQQVGAAGEILEGSISDAMLPLDRVKSQAPIEERKPEPINSDLEQPTITDRDRILLPDNPVSEPAPKLEEAPAKPVLEE